MNTEDNQVKEQETPAERQRSGLSPRVPFDPDKPRDLDGKRERFCHEYVIDLNGAKAARRAGYAEDLAASTACMLLKLPEVQTRLTEIRTELSERTNTDQDYVILKLRNWSDAKITDYFDVTGKGKRKKLSLKDLTDLPDHVIDAIQEIKQDKWGISIKLVDKKGSATDIGRHLGMFSDNLIVTPLSFEDLMLRRAKERAQKEEAAKDRAQKEEAGK